MITKHYNMKRTLLFFTAAILMISGASCQSKDNTTNQQRALKAQQTITPVEVAPIDGLDRAYFASGCFWCVEAVYESLKGVKESISGYSGGHTQNPTYASSNTGRTGHAEAVEIIYNAQEIRFSDLVDVYFGSQNIEQVNGQGPIQPNLHDSGADFAVWCTYKYLNSGPGSLGGCFVHERHQNNKQLNRFAGWWGHNKETRFNMRHEFDALPGAEGWQLSNPPILSMAAIRASLDTFKQAGFENLRAKSETLTGYLEFLLDELDNDDINIITPRNKDERGCQLSIQVKNADKALHTKLTQAGVISDWREPNVIRVAPAPLYNSYEDVFEFVTRLKSIL